MFTVIMNWVFRYFAIFKMGFFDSLEYRFNFFTEVLLWYIPLLVQVLLWKAVYSSYGHEILGGYSYAQMVTYCLIVMIVAALIRSEGTEWSVIGEIREGTLQRYLLQPVDFLFYKIVLVLSKKLVIIVCIVINLIPALLFFHDFFIFSISWPALLCFFLATILAMLILFYLQVTIALLAFWFTEFTAIFHFLPFVFSILDGTAFPLDILPPWLYRILSYSPFHYTVFFPSQILLGKMDLTSIGRGLGMQGGWVIVCLLLCKLTWMRGIKHFSATGG